MGSLSRIAGHTFIETPSGRRCETCGLSWLFVRSATKGDIGTTGFGHGPLLALEYAEIVVEREAEEDIIWDAVRAGAEGTPW